MARVKDDMLKEGININEIFKKLVGEGYNTLFWQDSWLGNDTLKVLFPDLYKLEKRKKMQSWKKNKQ